MSSTEGLVRIEEIQEELGKLMSEAEVSEEEVEKDLQRLEQKVRYLEDNVRDARNNDELNSMADLFIRVAHQLTKDVRSEKEITNEIQRLEKDEKTYIQLLNRIQSKDMPREKKQRLQSLIGKLPKDEVESSIEEDRKVEKNEEDITAEVEGRLSEIYDHLSHNLKGARMNSRLEDVRDAWIQLTHLESHRN